MFITGDLHTSGVVHGFFGRHGGVSSGIYESLNCGLGSDDERDAVTENRRRVLVALGLPAEALRTVYQVHSADVLSLPPIGGKVGWGGGSTGRESQASVDADRPPHPTLPPQVGGGLLPRADALVTDQAGIALGILTADCVPVLFAGRKADGAPVIGAAHAGWRGALGGVLKNTVAAMEGLGAVRDTISAAIGPCIAQASYEVQPDFLAPFLNDDPQASEFFVNRDGAWFFDLPGFALWRLRGAGIRAAWCGVDTYASADHFSYRRTTHRNEKDYGRQISVIGLSAAR